MKYDYIIAGSGCAGLSLLYRLLQEPTLANRTILVIDKDDKKTNDRTWCFWEKKPDIFEAVVCAQWDTLAFLSTDFQRELDLGDYRYKMIQGLDFYEFVLHFAKKFSNVSFVKEAIVSINSEETSATVTTSENSYTGRYVFNSTPIFNPEITEQNSLLQHFEGWVIATETDAFNDHVGRLMDFRLSQEHGATFMYVLPTSKREALVEYTLFTPTLLARETYGKALGAYIKDELQLEHYKIKHKEFGVIPMSLAKFEKNPLPNVINLGTAGGYTKASSGYTFQFIQKDTQAIVANLVATQNPSRSLSLKDKRFNWYDRTLIDVLLSEKVTGKEVFERIFKKIPATQILDFLGNESNLKTDINIMRRLPLLPFIGSGMKQF